MKLYTILALLAAFMMTGCQHDPSSATTAVVTPANAAAAARQELKGTPAPSDSNLSALPLGTFLQTTDTIEIHLDRTTDYPALNKTVAYFQGGRNLVGPDSAQWEKSAVALDPDGSSCVLAIDLKAAQALKGPAGDIMVIPAGSQFEFKSKNLIGDESDGVVSFDVEENPNHVFQIGCSLMTVKDFEEGIFGKKAEILIPAGSDHRRDQRQ